MKKISTTCSVTTTGIRGLLERNNQLIVVASIICFAFGLVLSHRIEPGVRIQKVTLAEETPALEFIPAGPGSHPVALLAHGLDWQARKRRSFATSWNFSTCQLYNPLEMVSVYRIPNAGRF